MIFVFHSENHIVLINTMDCTVQFNAEYLGNITELNLKIMLRRWLGTTKHVLIEIRECE